MGAASVDHCTYLSDDDIAALAGSDTVATFLPATDFSTRQPYPDARRAIDAGVEVAIATNCNPGSSYTTSMAFCIALAVRDMRMTPEEALLAATRGGARALQRDDVGRLAPGARADAVILDCPVLHAPRLPAGRAAGGRDRDGGDRGLGSRCRSRTAAQQAAPTRRPRQLVGPGPRNAEDVDPVIERRHHDLEPTVPVQIGD